MTLYLKVFKRLFDLVFSLILLIVLFPVFIAVCILLLIANNGSSFFVQARPGLYGRTFKLVKFKTMSDKVDQNGQLLPDVERMTRIGLFIRKTSLDEIPQLFNVIKGDMGLVGPRPLLIEYLPLYDDIQKRRHNVRPGITGWAQVNGRNAIDWGKKFEYDIWYINHLSFGLDLKIMWMTIIKIFKSEGINQAGNVTIEKFSGNKL